MGPVDRLVFDGRIPPAVEQEDVLRKLEVEPDRAGTIREQQHRVGRILAKPLDRLVAGGCRHAAVILDRAEPTELRSEPPERLHPLAEDERLAAAGLHLLELRREPVEFRALAGGRVEIADLLEPENEFEDVLNRGLPAHVRQPEHPLLLCLAVGLPLLGAEFDLGVAVEPRWHLGEHLVFGAAEDVVGHGRAHRPGRHPLADLPR